tara:strand:+ start:120 stop:779 length:660 start_codon:yes stop_codon:yes gene_type:complete
MNLLNKDFLNIHPNTFGTENVSLFLYSLIKTQRPSKLLEIGGGYSTFFIVQAIKDILNEIKTIKYTLEINSEFWESKYNPSLDLIENEVENNTSLTIIYNNLKKFKLDTFVNILKQDYTEITNNKHYDFIWLDVGSGKNLPYLFQKFFNILTEGGILIIHSTLTNLYGKLFITELKLEISKGRYPNIELISFLEPHKQSQNSFTVIKKTSNNPIYSIYA